MRATTLLLRAAIPGLAAAQVATAQGRAGSDAIFSIGQPSRYEFGGAVMAPLGARSNHPSVQISAEVYRSILNPLTGLLGARAEAYTRLGLQTFGLRAMAEARVVGLSAGMDWSTRDGLSPIVSVQSAIRRGGLFGRGSMLRADWTPGAESNVALGVTMPIGRPLAGKTRAASSTIDLARVAESMRRSSDAGAGVATVVGGADVDQLRLATATLAAYGNAFSSRTAGLIRSSARGYPGALSAYEAALRRLFDAASADTALTTRMVRAGRATMFDRVVLPIDSLFGQAKKQGDELKPLTHAATQRFAQWLADSSGMAPEKQARALGAFRAWASALDATYADLVGDVGDSRLVWLPFELALRAEEFDEQREVDSLMARAVGHPFTDQNALTYLRSSDLPLEIARSIYAARRYHVLWTHDFTARRESGEIDDIGYSMVADAYLPALTAAVKRYDSTGVLPAYIILQDQFFYEPRGNRLWMDILSDPLRASMRLPSDSGPREAHLVERRRELAAAVAASRRLQADARASVDAEAWIRDRVKVHVNIVEPSDFSFRSSHIVPGVSFTPDNVMREHRKIVLYDLDEADPYRGAMLIMGVGIGEHYASDTWEDRGYRARGPVTLEARRSVREALLRTGFTEAQIPQALRAVESPKAVEQNANTRDYVGRALQVHNAVGFGPKESSVARAILYNLAPPGSVIIVPDPMWLSDAWAGMLVAAAARGSRVYIIAPAAANAPSPQAPLMALQHIVLSRVLELSDSLAPVMRAAGGELRLGIFAAQAETNDPVSRAREIREGLARAPWIRNVIPFDAHTLAVLEAPNVLSASGRDATAIAKDEKARAQQLHQKSQLVARPGAIAALLRQPGWADALGASLRAQTRETARFADQFRWMTPDIDSSATRSNDALLRGYEQTVPEAERKRVSFYFSLGTQNQDTRGIVSDGEATLVVSGVQASVGLVDLFTLMARSEWVATRAGLERFNPAPSGFMRRIAWLFRAAF